MAGLELRLDDDAHRVLKPCDKGDDEKEGEHHRNGKGAVGGGCFHGCRNGWMSGRRT